jgi:predicted neuraminidase
VLIGNDTEQGRHQLAVWLSDDEGRTWRIARHLERDAEGRGRYAYPCAIQARDGTIHVTYSYALERDDLPRDEMGRPKRSAIKWARFDREWLLQGDSSGIL